jgi:accessory gene regulator protein AgrB
MRVYSYGVCFVTSEICNCVCFVYFVLTGYIMKCILADIYSVIYLS